MTAQLDSPAHLATELPAAGRRNELLRGVRGALPLWLASRVSVAVAVFAAGWLLRPPGARDVPSWLAGWYHWDVAQYQKVAEFGYFSPEYTDRTEAFFPGFPLLLRLVHVVVPNWTAAGLLVSAVAGAVAVVALWLLADLDSGERAATHAVTYCVLFPYAVFLVAGYSEAPFLAFVTTSWLAARRDRWLLAGVLGAGATSVRVTGLAFAAALVVQYAVQRAGSGGLGDRARRLLRPDLVWLALPGLPVLAYLTYLHSVTGRWDAYQEAQRAGWGRDTISPITTFQNTLAMARNLDQGADFLWSARVEIAAMAIGLVLTIVLLAGRRYGEATFVGLNVALLSVSTYYNASARSLLVWFPLYLLLGRLSARWDGLRLALVAVFAPLMVVLAIGFHTGTWLG